MQSVAAAAIQDEIRRKTLGSDGIKTELTIGNMCNVALLDVVDLGFESRWGQLGPLGSWASRRVSGTCPS